MCRMINNKIIGEGLGFDDVLINPNRSDIHSRYSDELDIHTTIARGAPRIAVPIIAANMDTVTEWFMAQKIGLHGGFGVLHRFMSIEEQVQQVRKVKERLRTLEDNPPFINQKASIQDALTLLQKRERGYVIVCETDTFTGEFVGIATPRDFDAGQLEDSIKKVMTEKSKLWSVKPGTSMGDAVKEMKKHRVEKMPVVSKDGHLVGVFTEKDYQYYQKYPTASLDAKGKIMIGAAIGVQEKEIERALALTEAGVDVIVLDIAHGALDYTKKMLHTLKVVERIKTPVIAGNVGDKEGALYVYESGADGIKVGIGPGFVCETRDVAGAGVPQITAIMEAADAVANKKEKIPIIADGGIRKPGDVVKAIAAGADAVMVGSLFAGTDESPGEPIIQNGSLVKMVRGMAASSAFEKRKKVGKTTTNSHDYVPEGRTTFTPYKGAMKKVLFSLGGGLRSGMSYVGAHTIKEMHEKAKFRLVRGTGAEQRRPLF